MRPCADPSPPVSRRPPSHPLRAGLQVGEIDNRGESFYISLYWAEALAEHDPATFAGLAAKLHAARAQIVKELADAQGRPVDIGGYYKPDPKLCARAMRPSPTFNSIIDEGREVGSCGVEALS